MRLGWDRGLGLDWSWVGIGLWLVWGKDLVQNQTLAISRFVTMVHNKAISFPTGPNEAKYLQFTNAQILLLYFNLEDIEKMKKYA